MHSGTSSVGVLGNKTAGTDLAGGGNKLNGKEQTRPAGTNSAGGNRREQTRPFPASGTGQPAGTDLACGNRDQTGRERAALEEHAGKGLCKNWSLQEQSLGDNVVSSP